MHYHQVTERLGIIKADGKEEKCESCLLGPFKQFHDRNIVREREEGAKSSGFDKCDSEEDSVRGHDLDLKLCEGKCWHHLFAMWLLLIML